LGSLYEVQLASTIAAMTLEEAARHTIELGNEHIREREECIARQCALIARLEAAGETVQAMAATEALAGMVKLLDRIRQDVHAAEKRLRRATGS
jgi:cation transport ATPase